MTAFEKLTELRFISADARANHTLHVFLLFHTSFYLRLSIYLLMGHLGRIAINLLSSTTESKIPQHSPETRDAINADTDLQVGSLPPD